MTCRLKSLFVYLKLFLSLLSHKGFYCWDKFFYFSMNFIVSLPYKFIIIWNFAHNMKFNFRINFIILGITLFIKKLHANLFGKYVKFPINKILYLLFVFKLIWYHIYTKINFHNFIFKYSLRIYFTARKQKYLIKIFKT